MERDAAQEWKLKNRRSNLPRQKKIGISGKRRGGDSQPTVDFLTGNQRSDNSADTKAQNQGSEEETSKGLSDQNVNQIARRQLIHLVNIWLNLDEDTRSAVMTLIGDQT